MNIREKLLQVQSKLRAPKSQSNDFGHYKYRSCEDILEALKPLLMELKTLLVLSDEVKFIENRFYVIATATFSDTEPPEGETISVTAWARENDIQKGMNEAQITGSVSSYARKYCLNGMFLIDDNREIDSLPEKEDKLKDKDKKSPPPKKEILSDEQIKRLYTIAGTKGYGSVEVKSTMLKKFKIVSASALTLAQYNTMVKGYEGLKDKEVVKNG